MTKYELNTIKEYCDKKQLLTKYDIEDFILTNFSNRKKSLMRFYIFDLLRKNVVYRLNSYYYKSCDKLVAFEYKYIDIDESIKENIEKRFPELDACIWSTNFLSNFMNLQPYILYTFVEVNSFYTEIVYDYLKTIFKNILINPNKDDLYHYGKGEDLVIVRKLQIRAPLEKPFNGLVGINNHLTYNNSRVFKQTIEKLIVDIFVDKEKINLYSEHDLIIYGFLKVYLVNFKKLFRYASYRGIENDIKNYIKNCIRFDVEKGVFYD
jgi:hypothetical protein